MGKILKARFWTGILYPENMREDWEECIGDTLQVPYAYCLHDRDKDSKSEHRKDHVHIIIVFSNTTTYNHALNVFDLLSAEGKKAINKCEAVVGVRNMYDYLIHDTEECRKNGKYQYPSSARITGNNFDIGAYEQLGTAEREEIIQTLNNAVKEHGFSNFMDLFIFVDDTFEDMHYMEVLRTNSAWYERLTRGNYQRLVQNYSQKSPFPSAPSQENNTTNTTEFCPNCGSIKIRKDGKTHAGTQILKCRDCGKRFARA